MAACPVGPIPTSVLVGKFKLINVNHVLHGDVIKKSKIFLVSINTSRIRVNYTHIIPLPITVVFMYLTVKYSDYSSFMVHKI